MIGVLVTEANASERLGAVIVLAQQQDRLSRLKVVWVDQGYSGKRFAEAVKLICGKDVQVDVIKRSSTTFEHLPKRWIVERSLVGSTAFDDLVKTMNCTVTLAKRWSMALY